jgi:hypothetical protein
MPLSRAFDVGGMPRTELTSAGLSSIAEGVAPGQPAGTDSRPRVLAWPTPADTGEPLKGARPANCGVGYHAPPAPAVVPVPNVSCCPMLQPKFPRPTPKYAWNTCRKAFRLALVRPRPYAPWGLLARVLWMNC